MRFYLVSNAVSKIRQFVTDVILSEVGQPRAQGELRTVSQPRTIHFD